MMGVTVDNSFYMQEALAMLERLQIAGRARNRATLLLGAALSDLYRPQGDGVFAWKRIAPECATWTQFLEAQDYLPSYSSCERAKTVYEVWGTIALHFVGDDWLDMLSKYPFSRLYDAAMLIKAGLDPLAVWQHLNVGYSAKDWGVWVATEKAALALPAVKPATPIEAYTQYTTPRHVPELTPPASLLFDEETGERRVIPAIAAVTVASIRTHRSLVQKIAQVRDALSAHLVSDAPVSKVIIQETIALLDNLLQYLTIREDEHEHQQQ